MHFLGCFLESDWQISSVLSELFISTRSIISSMRGRSCPTQVSKNSSAFLSLARAEIPIFFVLGSNAEAGILYSLISSMLCSHLNDPFFRTRYFLFRWMSQTKMRRDNGILPDRI